MDSFISSGLTKKEETHTLLCTRPIWLQTLVRIERAMYSRNVAVGIELAKGPKGTVPTESMYVRTLDK